MNENKQSKMTIDTLAVIIKKNFDEVENRLGERIDRLDSKIDAVDSKIDRVEQNLREEFITSSDKIIKQLEDMREEHAASFGLYKELEQKVFNLEQRVDELSKQMKQLQLKFSRA